MTTETILTIGLNDKVTKKQEVTQDNAIMTITNVIKHDMTIKSGLIGVFTHADGTKTIENSLEVHMFTDTSIKNIARGYALELCKLLNQESIVLEEKTSNAEFIGY